MCWTMMLKEASLEYKIKEFCSLESFVFYLEHYQGIHLGK